MGFFVCVLSCFDRIFCYHVRTQHLSAPNQTTRKRIQTEVMTYAMTNDGPAQSTQMLSDRDSHCLHCFYGAQNSRTVSM